MPILMTPHYWQLFSSQQTDVPVVASLNSEMARVAEMGMNYFEM